MQDKVQDLKKKRIFGTFLATLHDFAISADLSFVNDLSKKNVFVNDLSNG